MSSSSYKGFEMKMSKETYKMLQDDITRFVTKVGHSAIEEHREAVKDVAKDVYTRLCWDIFWKVSKETKDAIRAEKLNDSHLQTAIFKACAYNEINR